MIWGFEKVDAGSKPNHFQLVILQLSICNYGLSNLYQDTITITVADNYLTYPFLQLPKEIGLLKKVIADVAANDLKPIPQQGASRLWYEPTIWQYLYNETIKKVK
jgi:hypothetical protein